MAKKSRLTYVVRGSEDGTIGVFNVQGLAVAKACKYIENSSDGEPVTLEKRLQYLNYLKTNGWCSVEGNGVDAHIEGFIMNR